jgi:hypothetical protein
VLLATLGHGSLPAGARNGERSTGVPFRATPVLGQRCGVRATVAKQQRRRSSAAATLKLQERGKREGMGAVRTGGGVSFLKGR